MTATRLPTPRKVVHVDDEPLMLDLMRSYILSTFTNVTVQSFQDGRVASQELQHTDPDMLITDMVRPDHDGWWLLTLLRRNKVRYPILVTSGYATEAQVMECAASELNVQFLRKPFLMHQLCSELLPYLTLK